MSHVEDDGLARIGNQYFMVHSQSGNKLHAIDPKTKKTYCGKDMRKLWYKWRPIDKLPDDKNQPTCSICKRHYDEPIRESMRQVADDVREQIDKVLNLACMLKDAGKLGRLVDVVAKYVRAELVRDKVNAKLEKGDKH